MLCVSDRPNQMQAFDTLILYWIKGQNNGRRREAMEPNILYEDKEIIVCEKKPGMPVQSDRTLDMDLVNQLKNYLHQKEEGKQVYLGLVHRLDRPVGGVMVFGKTPEATKELSRQIQEKQMGKKYFCIVTKDLKEDIGKAPVLLTDYLKKDGRNNTSVVVSEKEKQGKCAKLSYTVKKVVGNCSMVEVELFTGRHHQIRVQMKTHVAGILGDTKYNPNQAGPGRHRGIALYSHMLSFAHPKTKERMEFHLNPTGEMWKPFFE